jgi:hypothetical protein
MILEEINILYQNYKGKKMNIGTVINYCENDHKFLKPCIDNVRKFSKNIVVSFCENLFNGQKQDLTKIQQFQLQNPDITFISFPFQQYYQNTPRDGHNKCRILGYEHLVGKVDKILFLDVDEIVDGDLFLDWLNNSPDVHNYDHMNFGCYWYYREPYWRATVNEFCGSFHDMKHIDRQSLESGAERWFWFNMHSNFARSKKYVTGKNGEIMFHHYSWVRTKEEMIKKVTSWGHKHDRNWLNDIEICFRVGFEGVPRKELDNKTETVHNYSYTKVEPFIKF